MLSSLVPFYLIILFADLLFALVIHAAPFMGLESNLTDFPLECYTAQVRQLKPTTLEDCRELAIGIMSLQPRGRPWVLSNVPGVERDYKIPLGLRHGSCHLRVVTLEHGKKLTEKFTARYFAHQVYKTINKCVIPWPHMGGEGEVGPKKELGLTISGPFADKVEPSEELTITQGRPPEIIEVPLVRLPNSSISVPLVAGSVA